MTTWEDSAWNEELDAVIGRDLEKTKEPHADMVAGTADPGRRRGGSDSRARMDDA